VTISRVLVVSACSKLKAKEGDAPTGSGLMAARDRYAGRAHVRVRDALDAMRAARPGDSVDWVIVSAGYGVVSEDDFIPDYDATFAGVSPQVAKERGRELGISTALRERLAQYDAGLFVLPLTYLSAAEAPFQLPTTQLYFASPAFAPESGRSTVVPCGIHHARALGVAAREVAAARFAAFASEAAARGLRPVLTAYALSGVAS